MLKSSYGSHFHHVADCNCNKWAARLIMDALSNTEAIIFSSSGFFLLLSFFSLPNLSSRRLDVYHTSTHGVARVQIQNAGLKCAVPGSLEMQDAKNSQKFAIWAPSHNFVGLYLRN